MKINLIFEDKHKEEINSYYHYEIESDSGNTYKVYLNGGKWMCTCSQEYNRNIKSTCKHLKAVKQYHKEAQQEEK